MAILSLPHLEIEYTEAGDPHGIPVLCLHGFPDAAAAWQPLIRGWSGPAVRFLVPDMRGYGGTRVHESPVSGEFAAMAADALALLDGLGIDRAVLLGHDWGARAAFSLAALHPERVQALVALASEYVAHRATGAMPHAQERAYWYQWLFNTPQGEQSLTRDRAGLCRLLWETWSPTWKFSEEEFAQTAEAWNNPQFVEAVLSYYRVRHGNASGGPRYAEATARLKSRPRIAAPTWYVLGAADACNLPEGSLGQEDWFSGPYKRVELPGIGHFVHREAPGAVAQVLAEALESLPQAPPFKSPV